VDTEIMEEVVTDDELLAALHRHLFGLGIGGYTVSDCDRLIALARHGAAVKWRPIDDDAKSGLPILCRCNMEGVEYCDVLYYEATEPEFPWRNNECEGYREDVPVSFIPLSALGEPET
jgi:hypothetical protein